MSTSAVASTSINQLVHQYFQTRQSDLAKLGDALSSGNLAGAQTQFNNITSLGQKGPFGGGNAFVVKQRESDFNAVGQALQSGDLAGAQQAYATLQSTFNPHPAAPAPTPTAASASPSGASGTSGPEIILNLSGASGSSSSPEQITINLANSAGGGEQVSLSVGNQGSNPEKFTFNLPANSNEQIVLNLLGSSSSTSTPTSTGGASPAAGINVSA
jgi:hypothetical protein